MKVDNAWPWNILWADKAHFHLQGSANTQNCRIWARRTRSKCNQCLFTLKRSLCGAGLRQHLSLALSFSRRLVLRVQSTGRFMNLFCGTSLFQHGNSADSTIFIQDGASSHIATPVKQLLNLHFGNGRIISRHFPTAWPPRSSDLSPFGV
ncbi:hypothetical protein AVEN_205308-1 [Araneus ventricosus]|uniref:Tc1-like transposase DDE domain-containing protein n=1 Tax=Araneus ventricosus TaxID=182803 RepID=A0A4Y2K6P0_ARAVE|nr:hypothetical protein AVEN_205308-1 [Araneus ventricosus]